MGDMQIEGKPISEATSTSQQTSLTVQKSPPSSTIHASTSPSEAVRAKATQITEVASKSMPKEESGAIATIKRAAAAFERSAVGKFFGAIALKIASVFEKHLLGVSSEAKQPTTQVPGEKPKVDLQKLFGENNNTQAVKDAICKADPFTVVTDFMGQLEAMYAHTPNPTREAQKFVKEALRELPPKAAKEWNGALAAQQHEDLQHVFEGANNDAELVANIQAVKANDPKVQFLCELRGVVAERLVPDKALAGPAVEHEFFKPEADALKKELDALDREIEQLSDEDPEKLQDKLNDLDHALRLSGSREEQNAFNQLLLKEGALEAHVQSLRDRRDELEQDLSLIMRNKPNPALQRALTS